MTKDEIIEMAKKAGMVKITKPTGIEIDDWWGVELSDIEQFAALVAEKEREACANAMAYIESFPTLTHGVLVTLPDAVNAIRARGQE